MAIMPTIMIGKIDIEFPAIHIINKFIGTCLIGPNAVSQDLCNIGETYLRCCTDLYLIYLVSFFEVQGN